MNAIGNLSNTVEAGYNNTTVSNSTNTTEVVNVTVPKYDGNKTVTNKNTTEKVFENKTNVFKTYFDKKATGNPLLILLMALIILPLRRFRK